MDEGVADMANSQRSSTFTLTSEVLQHIEENGRTYHEYNQGGK